MRVPVSLLTGLLVTLGGVAGMATAVSATTITYTYDDLGRLRTVCYNSVKQITYSYDPAGNRTSVVTLGACS